MILPLGAGVMSALGLLASPLAFELARSRRIRIDDIDARSSRHVRARSKRGDMHCPSAGVRGEATSASCCASTCATGPGLRDRGDAAGAADAAALFAPVAELFARAYEAVFGWPS